MSARLLLCWALINRTDALVECLCRQGSLRKRRAPPALAARLRPAARARAAAWRALLSMRSRRSTLEVSAVPKPALQPLRAAPRTRRPGPPRARAPARQQVGRRGPGANVEYIRALLRTCHCIGAPLRGRYRAGSSGWDGPFSNCGNGPRRCLSALPNAAPRRLLSVSECTPLGCDERGRASLPAVPRDGCQPNACAPRCCCPTPSAVRRARARCRPKSCKCSVDARHSAARGACAAFRRHRHRALRHSAVRLGGA